MPEPSPVEGVAENGVVELGEITSVGARGRLSPFFDLTPLIKFENIL